MGKAIFSPHDGFPLGFDPDLEAMDYKSLQEMVGGLIEATSPDIRGSMHRITAWMNDEARILHLPPNKWSTALNMETYGYPMHGDAVIMSSDDDGESVGLSDDELEWVTARLDKGAPIWYMEQALFPPSEILTYGFSWREVLTMTLQKRHDEQDNERGTT